MRKLLKRGLVVLAVLLLVLLTMKSRADARYFREHDAGLPLHALVEPSTVVQDEKEIFDVPQSRHYLRTEFSFEAREGERVPCVMAQPVSFEGRLPVIVFLHGSGQSKGFVEEICTPFTDAGFAMVSFDQHGRGGRKIKEKGLAELTAWRDRGWMTVSDTRRLIDYLVTRPDIDPERVYLVGASYGAMTGTHVLAREKRIKAAVLVVGGGNLRVMLDAPLIRDNVPALALAVLKPLAGFLAGPFDPVNSAPNVGPMPVLMQCGEDDTLVSPESGRELFEALGSPKELQWYNVDHPGLRKGDGPEVLRMLDEGKKWLMTHDAAHRAPAPAPAPNTQAQENAPEALAPAA